MRQPGIVHLLRNLLRRPQVEQDLDEELRSYLDQLTEQKARSGLAPAVARREALEEFGGIEQVKEEVRDVRRGHMLEGILQDVRYGFRTLAKNPSFAVIVILTLALGIGANTAMFSVAYGILQRPLPYPDADRVALVYMHFSPQNYPRGTMCLADYFDWKAQNQAFEEPSLYSSRRLDLAGNTEPEQVQGALVTSGFFSTLRSKPLIGRVFLPGEDRPGTPALAVLSESLWRRRFSAAPSVLGQALTLNGTSATIVGVMPDLFRFPRASTEIWTNLALVPPSRRGPFFYRGIGRLKAGVTLEQAQRDTNRIGQSIMRENPYYQNLTLPIERLRNALVGDVRTPLLVLIGAVGLVLLIAAVNVANLMLARATTRKSEMALRLSLGAGRGRLIRQLLTESLMLALAGGAAGMAAAYGGVAILRAWNPGNLPLMENVRIDGRALVFLLLIAITAGLVCGLAPALQGLRTNWNAALKEGRGSRTGAGSVARHLRSVLVVAEIALSLMLMAGAGLLLRSLQLLERVNAGFAAPAREILSLSVSPSDPKYAQTPAYKRLYREMLDRVTRLPGVESAALTDTLPPDRQSDSDTFRLEGQVLPFGESNPAVTVAIVSGDYFRTLRIPLRRGRYFAEADRENAPLVAIVSESFARRFFPGQDAVGRRMKVSGADNQMPWMEIVGVVGDVKYTGLDQQSDEAYYMPYEQSYGRRMSVVARSTLGAALAPALRRAVQAADPGVTLNDVESMDGSMSRSVALPRFDTWLLAVFASVALVLASVGIYGIIAYSVAQRTHEIGVRMALGAQQGNVLGMVIAQGAVLALAGVAIGLGGAFAVTHLLASLLFGVSSTDPLTFGGVAVVLLALALGASFVPARRATRISPVIALRYE